MIDVVLLWHMHQPYYVDPLTRTAVMPWVRLHCVKGYLDMIEVVRAHPSVRVNFNFTPVLVRQIRELARGEITDLWETWSRADANSLDESTRVSILEHFFKINWDTVVHRIPRYAELLQRRGEIINPRTLQESLRHFSAQDYRDLQVWFNLAWCGFTARKLFPELQELMEKGGHFSEEEKHRVLDLHREMVSSILDRYRELADAGQIEITTTPFFHPIMPLVYDTELARRCMPGRDLPQRFSAPEDVRAQLEWAQQQHQEVFGTRARGLWPSEGSVCPELLPIFREVGIEYFLTDEDNLFRSLPAGTDHLQLFQPWRCVHEGAEVKALFRERPLSDFIGFNAARNSAEHAAGHVRHLLDHLDEVVPHRHKTVCLALDGENAWEAFVDGGEAFLHELYHQIDSSERLALRRMGEVMDSAHDLPCCESLHTGSWIGADFDIWIGDPEENLAWERVRQVRQWLVQQEAQGVGDEAARRAAWEEIYAAEGSDWFWWYGPDFQNDSVMLFDQLFRTHLMNVFRLLGHTPPEFLSIPIRSPGQMVALQAPTASISPSLHPEAEAFFDWMGAGCLDVSQQQTAMFQADRVGRKLWFGFDHEAFYLRFDFEGPAPDALTLHWLKPRSVRVIIPVRSDKAAGRVEPSVAWSEDGVKFETVEQAGARAMVGKQRIVARVPWSDLRWTPESGRLSFHALLQRGGLEVERYPERSLIELEGPTREFFLRQWFV